MGYVYYDEDIEDPGIDPRIREKIIFWADCSLGDFAFKAENKAKTAFSAIIIREVLQHQADTHGILQAYQALVAKISDQWTFLRGTDHQDAEVLFQVGLLEQKRTPTWKDGCYRGQNVYFRKLQKINYNA